MKIIASAFIIFGLSALNSVEAAPSSAYLGQESREVKALSDEEIRAYLEGSGAGLAKAAELNHYPGPAHVLELARDLHLSDEQKSRTQSIFDTMQKGAMQLGQALVEKERELDRQFSGKAVTQASLHALLDQIGLLQAAIRRYHLQAHIEQYAILTEAQIVRYDALRGYTSATAAKSHDPHRH